MAPVKRSYNSPLRRDRAQDTRDVIVTAAIELFSERGYVATSLDLVAKHAGTSRANLFKSVGGKPQLLRAAYRAAVRGNDPDVPLGRQRRAQQILSDPDPFRLLAGYAAVVAELAPRLAPLYKAIASAADADADAHELWQELQQERHFGASRVVTALNRLNALRDGLSPGDATDILWVLNDAGLYLKLVSDRGWTHAAYSHWLTRSMHTELLDPAR